MRQNKNVTIAYDMLDEDEKLTIQCLECIAKSTGRSISQIAKIILEMGLIKYAECLKRDFGIETK